MLLAPLPGSGIGKQEAKNMVSCLGSFHAPWSLRRRLVGFPRAPSLSLLKLTLIAPPL